MESSQSAEALSALFSIGQPAFVWGPQGIGKSRVVKQTAQTINLELIDIEDVIMKISWKIKKKRGNYRPVLTYTMTLEAFEKSLAIHAVSVESCIPQLPRPHENFCLPGENEHLPH